MRRALVETKHVFVVWRGFRWEAWAGAWNSGISMEFLGLTMSVLW